MSKSIDSDSSYSDESHFTVSNSRNGSDSLSVKSSERRILPQDVETTFSNLPGSSNAPLGGDFSNEIQAHLTSCTDAQIGPRFIAEKMKFTIYKVGKVKPGAKAKKTFLEKFEVIDAGNDESGQTKVTPSAKYRPYYKFIAILVSLFAIIFLLVLIYLSIPTVFPNGNRPSNKSSLASTKKNISTNILNIVHDKNKPCLKENCSNHNDLIDTFNSPLSTTGDFLHEQDTSKYCNNTLCKFSATDTDIFIDCSFSLLKASKLDPVHFLFTKQRLFTTVTGFKVTNKVSVTFHQSTCTFFECLKEFHDRELKYNFILLRQLLYVGLGWHEMELYEPSLQIHLIFGGQKETEERQLYLFMVLMNASRRCGYLSDNFTVDAPYDWKHFPGYDYQMVTDVLKASEKEKYLVDDKDSFAADSVWLSTQIYKPCPLFKTCKRPCDDQTCLQNVYNPDDLEQLCYVQCL